MFLKAFSKPAKHYGFKIITLPEKYNRIMLIVVFSLFKAYYLEIQELDETCYCIYDFSKKNLPTTDFNDRVCARLACSPISSVPSSLASATMASLACKI